LGAPPDYDAGRRENNCDTDQSFQLSPFQASQEELLAVLTARNLLPHVSGGYLSRAIGRLGNKITALCDERVKADDRLTTHFSYSWHGHSPVDEILFRMLVGHRAPQTSQKSIPFLPTSGVSLKPIF
jgi:predicted DNA-binding transcriptional regulator YafY